MPTYSTKRPVRILLKEGKDYLDEHLAHFFNTVTLNAFHGMTEEEKIKVYELLTDYEDILVKIHGDGLLKSNVFLPELLRKGVNNDLVKNYKIWLDKR